MDIHFDKVIAKKSQCLDLSRVICKCELNIKLAYL